METRRSGPWFRLFRRGYLSIARAATKQLAAAARLPIDSWRGQQTTGPQSGYLSIAG